MFTKISKLLADSVSALVHSERRYVKGERIMQQVSNVDAVMKEAELLADRINAASQQGESPDLDEAKTIAGLVRKTSSSNAGFLLLAGEKKEGKEQVDVNTVCEELIAVGSNGIQTEEGTFQVPITRDLEKNLPAVNINEQHLQRVLLYLINNAINACYRQSKIITKGYQPKIIISTRVLPRFVQVKVKDNGTGITDAILENIYDPFYTTEPTMRPGLGLAVGKEMIAENKGELKIESSLDRGTDVTVKLFLENKSR